MKENENYSPNNYSACKSLPNILLSSSKSSQTLQLQRSQSLSSCLKFLPTTFQYHKKISILNILKSEKKKSNPTIGELLGDNDLFHYRYQHQYSSSRSRRKRHHSRSSSIHVHYNRRIQRRSTYSNTHEIYPYSTIYNYTPIPAYCYYCYTNMNSCCSCLISDYYRGFYQYYETSTL